MYSGLLWKVVDQYQKVYPTDANPYPSSTSERAKSYRAPSWSWSSINGIVELAWFKDEWGVPFYSGLWSPTPRAEILSTDIELKYPEYPYGQIQSGKLVIQGRIYGLWYYPDQPDWILKKKLMFKNWKVDDFQIDADEHIENETLNGAFFLPIVLRSRTKNLDIPAGIRVSKDPKTMALGLVLCPGLGEERRYFRRVAYVEIPRGHLDKIDKIAQLSSWEDEDATKRCFQVISPNEALERGNVIAGVFELV